MKTIILLTGMIIAMFANLEAQDFKHFNVEKLPYMWKIVPKFDQRPQQGINGIQGGDHLFIRALIKKAIRAELPEDIKQEITKRDVLANILVNAKGEIFYIAFILRGKDYSFLNNEQWLKVYQTIRKLNIDLSQLELIENFEWGDGGIYPLHKYLK